VCVPFAALVDLTEAPHDTPSRRPHSPHRSDRSVIQHGAMGRYGVKPVIILLNNSMYGVE
jgi:hypothetical protein